MKNVLIVSDSPLFREFLKDKLAEKKVSTTVINDKRDVVIKMSSMLPDLVILERNEYEDTEYFMDVLSHIKEDPNASRIPMIATGPSVDKSELAGFARYGLHKYFVKPINFDIFFQSVSSILKTNFIMDVTPCVMDVHRNDTVIFVEIAQGLNRDRISLLKYKLAEIIKENELESPKVLVMLTNIGLSFVDGLNIEYLLDNILANNAIENRNVKILSFSPFVKNLVDGHSEYDGIEIATDISQILNSLVNSTSSRQISDLIADKILTTTDTKSEGCIELRGTMEEMSEQPAPAAVQGAQEDSEKAKIAIIDDDQIIRRLISAGFEHAGYKCDVYASGTDFLSNVSAAKYSAIILDILMPGLNGLDTLKRLQGLPEKPAIIIYSQAVQKELVVQCLALGAKQYLVKPQKPDVIVKKVEELLNAAQW